jgi:mannitol-specific phosphotransferase system IIBC component
LHDRILQILQFFGRQFVTLFLAAGVVFAVQQLFFFVVLDVVRLLRVEVSIVGVLPVLRLLMTSTLRRDVRGGFVHGIVAVGQIAAATLVMALTPTTLADVVASFALMRPFRVVRTVF